MTEERLKYFYIHARLQRGGGHGVPEAVYVEARHVSCITGAEKSLAQLLGRQITDVQRRGSAPGAAQGIDQRIRKRQGSATCSRLWGFVDRLTGDCHTLIFNVDPSGNKIDVRPSQTEEFTSSETAKQGEQPHVIERAKAVSHEKLVDNID